MKLFKNQKGFNDVITMTIIGGIVGALFIGGVFVWQEYNYQKNGARLVSTFLENNSKSSDKKLCVIAEGCDEGEELPVEEILSVVNRQRSGLYFSGIFESINDECRYENCLLKDIYAEYVPDWVFGTFKVKGWYDKVDRIGEGLAVMACDTLFIEEAPEEIMNLYPEGEMNIMLGQLNDSDKQRLFSSSEDNPAELILFQYPALGATGYTCLSHVDVVRVK